MTDRQFTGLAFPSGRELVVELFFHEGQTTNTTTRIDNKVYPYNSLDVVNALKQLTDAKADAFRTTIDHVKQFDEVNPKGYVAWVKTVWFTDQASREITPANDAPSMAFRGYTPRRGDMTANMKGVHASGVPGNF